MMLIFHKLYFSSSLTDRYFYSTSLSLTYVFHMLIADDASIVRILFLLSLVSICFNDVIARGQMGALRFLNYFGGCGYRG